MFIEVDIKKLAQEALKYSAQKEQYSEYLKQLLNDSIDFWEKNDLKQAIVMCDLFIGIEPHINFGHLLKAVLLTSGKNYTVSRDVIGHILPSELNNIELEIYYFIFSCNSFYTGRPEEALMHCNKLIALGPTNNTIYLIRGFANAELENHNDAIQDFKQSLKDKWMINEIKANLAYSYLRSGNRLKSLLMYRSIVKHFPDNWKVQYNMGLSYFKLKLYTRALIYLNKTAEINPDFEGTYLTRGFIYLTRGLRKEAVEDWEMAKKLGGSKKVEHLMKKYYSRY